MYHIHTHSGLCQGTLPWFYNLHTGSWSWPCPDRYTSTNKPLDMSGYPADPRACQRFGKYASKNKQGRAESLWRSDNGFTASCGSRVREQTTPSLSGGGEGRGRLGNRRCQQGIICSCEHAAEKLAGRPGSVLDRAGTRSFSQRHARAQMSENPGSERLNVKLTTDAE